MSLVYDDVLLFDDGVERKVDIDRCYSARVRQEVY